MSRRFDVIRDVWRGTCPCGKWLVISPGFDEKNKLVCHGPCHQDKVCGRKYYIKGKTTHDFELVKEEADGC